MNLRHARFLEPERPAPLAAPPPLVVRFEPQEPPQLRALHFLVRKRALLPWTKDELREVVRLVEELANER